MVELRGEARSVQWVLRSIVTEYQGCPEQLACSLVRCTACPSLLLSASGLLSPNVQSSNGVCVVCWLACFLQLCLQHRLQAEVGRGAKGVAVQSGRQ